MLLIFSLCFSYALCSSLTFVKYPSIWELDTGHLRLHGNSLESLLLNLFGFPSPVPSPVTTRAAHFTPQLGLFFAVLDWDFRGDSSVHFRSSGNGESFNNFLLQASKYYSINFEQIKANESMDAYFEECCSNVGGYSIMIIDIGRIGTNIKPESLVLQINKACSKLSEKSTKKAVACFVIDSLVSVDMLHQKFEKRSADEQRQGTDSDFVDMSYPVTFHIIFWTSFSLILTLCFAWYKLICMDPGKESILYRSFGSTKPKQE